MQKYWPENLQIAAESRKNMYENYLFLAIWMPTTFTD